MTEMTHLDQVLQLLQKQIGRPDEVKDIQETAKEVSQHWVDPLSGGKEEVNGLVYGLVQSGKTGVLTVTGAMSADQGYRTLIVLTSDIDPLYEQTLTRVKHAFPGMDIIGKQDLSDPSKFSRRLRGTTCAIVVTKNSSVLKKLIENFQLAKVPGLSCLIIDDEADQASLNTRANRNDGSQSAINERIASIRGFFHKNTYLQVTATPQSLFLQLQNHAFRPKFTVLSHPGKAYVGGDDFFGENSPLIRTFDLNDVTTLAPGSQPNPTFEIPQSLLRALDIFMIGATFKRLTDVDANCAFLCHVSTKTSDHRHIESLLHKYKSDLSEKLKTSDAATKKRLKAAYDDLRTTHPSMQNASYDELLAAVQFFSAGINVKLVNGETDSDVAVDSPYNLFVGGNKLGRGVTIQNLLVSYYGRNPKKPQADTVLQHARMYGYRRKDIGLLRLYLPQALLTVFRAIHQMEKGLRDLIARRPSEDFRGVYLKDGVSATRKNVLAPGSIGVYSAGSIYNPAQVLRTTETKDSLAKMDLKLQDVGNKSTTILPLSELAQLIRLVLPDPDEAEMVWDQDAVAESIIQFGKLHNQQEGYLYVDRDRDLKESRRETQGILSGGETNQVPKDKVALFMLRTAGKSSAFSAWWPQVRFPDGRYAFAFAL